MTLQSATIEHPKLEAASTDHLEITSCQRRGSRSYNLLAQSIMKLQAVSAGGHEVTSCQRRAS